MRPADSLRRPNHVAIRHEVFAIARKALMGLATVSLEEHLGEVFTRRLRDMDPGARAKALMTTSDAALVSSAFELPLEQRAAIQKCAQ